MSQRDPSKESAATEPVQRHAQQSAATKYVVAAVWALAVGLLMAGGAALLDERASDVLLIGVLGGLGAAVYVLGFTGSA
jgi:hypothetical protein